MAAKKKTTKRKPAKKKAARKTKATTKRPSRAKHRTGVLPGRPSGCTPEITQKICEKICAGAFLEEAMATVGKHKSTYPVWRKKGETALENFEKGQKLSEADKNYANFYLATKQAEAELQEQHIGIVMKAAHGYTEVTESEDEFVGEDGKPMTVKKRKEVHKFDVKAAEWLLERRFPTLWGKLRAQEESIRFDEFGKTVTIVRGPAPGAVEDD